MDKRHSKKKRNKAKPEMGEATNLPKGPIFDIRTSKIMGRYMVSTRNLQPGDLILSEEPIVVGPCTGCKIQCLGCYKILENPCDSIPCTGCKWLLCSQSCPGLYKKHGHTQLECDTLKTTNSWKLHDTDKQIETTRTYYYAIVPLRCLLLKTSDPQQYARLLQMETHNEIRKNIPELWQTNQEMIVKRIRNDWGLKQYTEDEIHSICGVLEVNSFEIGQNGINIRGLYPTAFLMSHDCIPNTNHNDEEDTYRLTVRASVRIGVGQPITLSYAYTLQSTLKRREHLMENKFFECRCKRCTDPTELGTYMGALICPKCRNCVLSTDPLNQDAQWSCIDKKSCPGYTITAKSMQKLIDRISQEIENIDCNDIKTMEDCLQKYRNVLHPTHYLCIGLKLSLSQLYGKISNYLIHELDCETLIRKQQICEEILTIFNIIEPGYTKLRGVTLYELHAPVMILITRQLENFNQHNHNKNELRLKLKKVVKCLEEASVILTNEPKSSNEGMMGLAAKDALIKIRDWEKILGRF